MNYQDLIGLPLERVKKILKSKLISYIVEENSDLQRKYDTVLVVDIIKERDVTKLVVDKFLLDI